MKVGYFCYRLSGTGPRTRAADIIEAVATESDHEVVVLTNEPENVRGPATVHPISLDDPLSALATTRRAFADADVVHVPVNMYQVLFVRLVYWGPLVGGVGPGLQPSAFHRYLGRLLRIDKKIKVLEHNKLWDDSGYDTAVCTATIDTDRFYQYDDERVRELRREWGIGDEETVVLYVGALIEEQGPDSSTRWPGSPATRTISASSSPATARWPTSSATARTSSSRGSSTTRTCRRTTTWPT
ncbi:hypothetical protein ACFQL4_18525 [Halosimplex aquaticum]